MMRRCDVMNHKQLSEKIAANAEQSMPLLLKKYVTCLQDEFIELANLILARSEVRYTQTLRELYPQIRAPYAQANACLTFGIQGMTQQIPFLLSSIAVFGVFIRRKVFLSIRFWRCIFCMEKVRILPSLPTLDKSRLACFYQCGSGATLRPGFLDESKSKDSKIAAGRAAAYMRV